MGYHTDFEGSFSITPSLREHHLAYLRKFSAIRHGKRDVAVAGATPDPLREAVGLTLGPDAAFFVGAKCWYGGSLEDPTLEPESSFAHSQPQSYYCHWEPSQDGRYLSWDGGETFYEYIEWLEYIIVQFLVPWGYSLSGEVRWEGEDEWDIGTMMVKNNIVSLLGPITVTNPDGSARKLRVFLCYASQDHCKIRALFKRLDGDRIEPWMDKENLIPGQDWELEIRRAIRASDLVLVALSRLSVTKAGFNQKEIRFALDVADEQSEGEIFIVPVKLEECDAPERLRRWQWVSLFDPGGYESLWRSLDARARSLTSSENVKLDR